MTSVVGRRVVFHVGAHKTATSLIQKYLRDMPDESHAWGLRYVGRDETNELVGWGKKLVGNPERLQLRVRKEFEDGNARCVFLSHENTLGRPFVDGKTGLYPHARKNLRALREALDGFSTTVVLSVRPQVEFIQSYYLQLIHEGNYMTFAEWLSELDLDALKWEGVVQEITDIFGDDAACVVDFQDIKAGQDAFIQQFFARIAPGLQITKPYKPVRNASISERGLQIALAVNPLLQSDDERSLFRKFLQKNFSNRKQARPSLFSPDRAEMLRAQYESDYSLVTKQPTAKIPEGLR